MSADSDVQLSQQIPNGDPLDVQLHQPPQRSATHIFGHPASLSAEVGGIASCSSVDGVRALCQSSQPPRSVGDHHFGTCDDFSGANSTMPDSGKNSGMHCNFAGIPDFRCVTWNCRGLCVRNPTLRQKKFAAFGRIARRADIVCLQEAHGSELLMNQALGHIRKSFHVFCDIPWRGSGGVAILVRKMFCPLFHSIMFGSIVPGRICRISSEF